MRLFLICVVSDILPKLIDLFVPQHALPWRHLVFAIEYGILKPYAIAGGQAAQVESLARTDQILAVAGRAVVVEDCFSGVDFHLVLSQQLPDRLCRDRGHKADDKPQTLRSGLRFNCEPEAYRMLPVTWAGRLQGCRRASCADG